MKIPFVSLIFMKAGFNTHTSIVKYLKKRSSEGVLFHGSLRKVVLLKPQTPLHASSCAGKVRAVYASDLPLIAMFNAIVNIKKLPRVRGIRKAVLGWGYHDELGFGFLVTPNIIKHKAFRRGYIYLVKKESFTPIKGLQHEYYSKKAVVPLEIISTTPAEFFHSANVYLWPKKNIQLQGTHTDQEIKIMGYDETDILAKPVSIKEYR